MQITRSAPTQAHPAALPTSEFAGEPAEHGQYLIFNLGGESFAIGILAIKEIIEYGSLTQVPMMPEAVRGVINLRGSVVPVIDLSARFGRKPTVVGRRTCIVIVELAHGGERSDVGVIVDAVNEVIEIPPTEIEPAPSFGAKIHTEFITGMGKVDGKFIIILDVGKVLSVEEIGAISRVDTTHQEIGSCEALAV